MDATHAFLTMEPVGDNDWMVNELNNGRMGRNQIRTRAHLVRRVLQEHRVSNATQTYLGQTIVTRFLSIFYAGKLTQH